MLTLKERNGSESPQVPYLDLPLLFKEVSLSYGPDQDGFVFCNLRATAYKNRAGDRYHPCQISVYLPNRMDSGMVLKVCEELKVLAVWQEALNLRLREAGLLIELPE